MKRASNFYLYPAAWLAALAVEYRATLVSTDQGFDRFPGLDWLNPTS